MSWDCLLEGLGGGGRLEGTGSLGESCFFAAVGGVDDGDLGGGGFPLRGAGGCGGF